MYTASSTSGGRLGTMTQPNQVHRKGGLRNSASTFRIKQYSLVVISTSWMCHCATQWRLGYDPVGLWTAVTCSSSTTKSGTSPTRNQATTSLEQHQEDPFQTSLATTGTSRDKVECIHESLKWFTKFGDACLKQGESTFKRLQRGESRQRLLTAAETYTDTP